MYDDNINKEENKYSEVCRSIQLTHVVNFNNYNIDKLTGVEDKSFANRIENKEFLELDYESKDLKSIIDENRNSIGFTDSKFAKSDNFLFSKEHKVAEIFQENMTKI